MNSVSLFLLLSDIIPRFMFLGIIFVAFGGVLAFFLPKDNKTELFSYEHNPFQGFLRKETYIVLITGLILMFATPSRETFQLIVDSQIGEQIIQLEEVQQIGGEAGGLAKDAIELLRQQIQEQLVERPAEGG